MIFVLDQTGRVLYTNHAVSERLGYAPADLLKMELSDLHPPEQRQAVRDLFAKLIIGEAAVCNIPLLSKDGKHVPVEILGALGKWGEIDAIFGIARDLSESHRARSVLHESESRFRAIFESAAVGLTLVDLQGTVLAVNATFAKMLGYKPEELIGKRYTEFIHAQDIVGPEACGRDHQPTAHKIVLEKQYIHRNGEIIWGRLNVSLIRDAQGAPLYCIGIIENITDHKRTVDRLRENEAFLSSLFDNMPDHVFVVDHDAKIVFANHDATGSGKENLIGEEGYGFIDAAYKEQCREAFARVVHAQGPARGMHGCIQPILVMCRRALHLSWRGAAGHGDLHESAEQRQAAAAIQQDQQLLRQIIDLHERDRQVTAYEIHDGIAQQVTASILHLDAFRRLRNSDAAAAEKSLDTTSKLLSQSVDETRRIISGLRPLILDKYGLVEAIDYLVCENREKSGIRIEFRHDVPLERLAAAGKHRLSHGRKPSPMPAAIAKATPSSWNSCKAATDCISRSRTTASVSIPPPCRKDVLA